MTVRAAACCLLAAVLLGLAVPAQALEDSAAAEIEGLLVALGNSGCDFVRNGKVHEAADAEQHLRLKLRRGKAYVSSAEDFIERLASASSWSGEPYSVRCPDRPERPAAQWLSELLARQRAGD